MKLKPLSSQDMETVREWRDSAPETLRTPYDLTREMQQDYYKNEICNRDSRTRYWGIWEQIACGRKPSIPVDDDQFNHLIGYGGIENIEWENSRGEISLLIGPDYRKQGYGTKAVEAILFKAFHFLGLRNVHGECYYSSPATEFWGRIVRKYGGFERNFPETKFYEGHFHDSYLFDFRREEWENRNE